MLEGAAEAAEAAEPGEETIKQVLERLLRAKSPRVALRGNTKGKNRLIWSQFDIVHLDGDEQPYAICKLCKCLMKYSGRTGTGGLMRHFCFREACRAQGLEVDRLERIKGEDSEGADHPDTAKRPPHLEKTSLRAQLEVLIFQSSPRVGFMSNYKGKSGVWSQFQILTLDKVPVDFACCVVCRTVVSYISKTGTGSMTRHKCVGTQFVPAILRKRRLPPPRQWDPEDGVKAEPWDTPPPPVCQASPPPAPYFTFADLLRRGSPHPPPSPPSPPSLPPDRGLEELVKDKHLAFLKSSLNLLNMAHNESFLQLAQALVDLGAQYGKVDVRKLFHDHVNFNDLLQD